MYPKKRTGRKEAPTKGCDDDEVWIDKLEKTKKETGVYSLHH
jgi:hypothetical protein